MPQPDIIQTILKDSNYRVDLFNKSEIRDSHQKVVKEIHRPKNPRNPCNLRKSAIQTSNVA